MPVRSSVPTSVTASLDYSSLSTTVGLSSSTGVVTTLRVVRWRYWQVSDRTLGELFSLNPREMNDEDRLDVIRRFREARDKWNSEKTAAKNEGRKKKTDRKSTRL